MYLSKQRFDTITLLLEFNCKNVTFPFADLLWLYQTVWLYEQRSQTQSGKLLYFWKNTSTCFWCLDTL